MWGVRGHHTDIGDFNLRVGWFLVGGGGGGIRVKCRGWMLILYGVGGLGV